MFEFAGRIVASLENDFVEEDDFVRYKYLQILFMFVSSSNRIFILFAFENEPVSYTHLDVYKRQAYNNILLQAGNDELGKRKEITGMEAEAIDGVMYSYGAVSYTHLDVYKRQELRSQHFLHLQNR